MNAKEYLAQIKALDALIESVSAVIKEKEEKAERTTSAIKAYMRPSPTTQLMADTIDEYVDIERGELRELIRERQEIKDTMKLLPTKERGVLYCRYVLGYEFFDIATAYDRSESWAKSMTKTALDNLQKILDERNKHGQSSNS